MTRLIVALVLLVTWGCGPSDDQTRDLPSVELWAGDDRVDVTVDGRPFTSYLYATAIPAVKKPILYPVYAPSGRRVTRGFPLDPVPGERADHPHHIGMWLNHGDVNDLDFWNNSDAIDPTDSLRYGSIRHTGVVDVTGGRERGTLDVVAEWLSPRGVALLEEQTRFIFEAALEAWSIDRITTLTALEDSVVFEDSKEGMMAIRVARALEQVTGRADPFVTNDGSLSERVVSNDGATGRYLSSAGLEGDAVWGRRASWTALTGEIEGEMVTIAIFDHPSNVNYPTHWMARGYGLFAANPLGSHDYTDGAERLDYTLAPGESVTFRYRMLIHSGPRPSSEWLDEQQVRFAAND
ncbi:MAG TPA: PmoA family protein [Rhodothermales bacterium]|nr:PmoA family protein [Rhodothermales bacterium]